MNVDMVLTYLEFVAERHRIWEQRQAGAPQPWTSDPILASRKFTNVFRVLDPGSQFALRLVDEPGISERDALMRAFLYRHTNRPEPWEFFELMHGRMPLVGDLTQAYETWKTFRGEGKPRSEGMGTQYERNVFSPAYQINDLKYVWEAYRGAHERSIFSGAYVVFPQSQTPGTDKLESILFLASRLFHPDSPDDVMPAWERAATQEQRFETLRKNKGVGVFMAMQTLTDYGYSHHGAADENEFIAYGPGATRGVAALGLPATTASIAWLHSMLQELPDCPRLAGRPPSYMDVQNTLCEFSKYARFMGQPNRAAPYVPAHPGSQPEPVLPAHWRTR